MLLGASLIAWTGLFVAGSQAQQTGQFAVVPPINFETGDTWQQAGARYRLYGVQACLRGTQITERSGRKADCGERSIAMLAAIMHAAKPECRQVGPAQDGATFVVCGGVLDGKAIEVGTALIAGGFAFAAAGPDGRAVHAPYLVAEQTAESASAGLWAFTDMPHPVQMLLGTRVVQ